MNFHNFFQKIYLHIVAIVLFIAVSSIYFYPAYEGKSLQGEDVIGGVGKYREAGDFKKYENKSVIWNGSIFSGMPNYVGLHYKGATNLNFIYSIPQSMGMPREVAAIFWYMLGFYILLIAFGLNPWIAITGSIVFALTSYNLIIIHAGHYMKVYTISLIPSALAGILLCFKRKYISGFILSAFFIAMMINMAHIQMIYYFLLALICIGIVEFIAHYKKKEIPYFIKSGGIILLAGLLAIAPNFARLSNYYKYNKESIRGKNELSINKQQGRKDIKGLDKDYINAWSCGRAESMMIFAPYVKGGSTGQIKNNKALAKKLPAKNKKILENMNTYWGNQPFSGGANFFGVVVLVLFFMGLFLIKGRLKSSVLVIFVLMMLLSLGRHFSTFTDLFIDYVPFYNKFRTPVSILGVLVIFVIFFATYTLHRFVKNPNLLEKSKLTNIFKKEKPIYLLVSVGLLLFILLNIAFPGLFNSYISDQEKKYFNKLMQQNNNVSIQIQSIIDSLKEFRIAVFRSELWRVLLFIILTTLTVFLYAKRKIKPIVLVVVIGILAIVDVWSVGKRYVGNDKFLKKNLVRASNEITATDRKIYMWELNRNEKVKKRVTALLSAFPPKNEEERESLLRFAVNSSAHFRVFDLTRDPFNENFTASSHKSIGGYHSIKLRRYQDMIEHHISKKNRQVLNMLNTKYIINKEGLRVNSEAMGVAWFVDSVYWANDVNDEILALNRIDVKKTAVLHIKDKIPFSFSSEKGIIDTIELVSYNPDHMIYHSNCENERLAVFSEVSYPDWKLYIDEKPVPYYTANYILRAAVIPSGNHKIEFIFDTHFFRLSNYISQFSFYLFLIVVMGLIGWDVYKKAKS